MASSFFEQDFFFYYYIPVSLPVTRKVAGSAIGFPTLIARVVRALAAAATAGADLGGGDRLLVRVLEQKAFVVVIFEDSQVFRCVLFHCIPVWHERREGALVRRRRGRGLWEELEWGAVGRGRRRRRGDQRRGGRDQVRA